VTSILFSCHAGRDNICPKIQRHGLMTSFWSKGEWMGKIPARSLCPGMRRLKGSFSEEKVSERPHINHGSQSATHMLRTQCTLRKDLTRPGHALLMDL